MKKILFIIAPQDFRDEEYFIPRDVFIKSGIEVVTISTKKGVAFGVQGGEAEIDVEKEEINLDDFCSVIFVGGGGAVKYLDNDYFYNLARKSFEKGLILAAICIAQVILARAGLLKEKKVTVWSSEINKSAIKIIEEGGGIYKKEDVVTDGMIVTANGPDAVEKFAKEILNLTKKFK